MANGHDAPANGRNGKLMQELAEHIEQLTRDLKITIIDHPIRPVEGWEGELSCIERWQGGSNPYLRQIEIHPVKNIQRYITALHEIGHVIYKHGARNVFSTANKVCTEEVEATEYSLENSVVPIDDTLMEEIRHCLRSYLFNPADPKSKWLPEPSTSFGTGNGFPPKDNPIWKLANEECPVWRPEGAVIKCSGIWDVTFDFDLEFGGAPKFEGGYAAFEPKPILQPVSFDLNDLKELK